MNRILRIGIFTAVGVFAIVAFSIYVNDHPYWYRSCNEVKIHVDDATGLRRKSPVKTLGLDIGNAETPMTDRMAAGVPQADGSIKVEPRMNVQHVADAVLHMAGLPLEANVQFMTIMATKMPFVGRG